MLTIRFRRIGKKNRPSFRVVVAEHSFATGGRFVADVGFYDPHTKRAALKTDEIEKWLDRGVRPSNSVAKLLQREKVKHKLIVVVQRKRAPKIKQEAEAKTSLSVSSDVTEPANKTVEAGNAEALESELSDSESQASNREAEDLPSVDAPPVADTKS